MQPEFIPNTGQLVGVWLKAIDFEENEDFDPERHQVTYSLNVDHETDTELGEGKGSVIEVSLSLEWEAADAEKVSPPPFDLTVVVHGMFEWQEPRDEDFRRGWTDYNGVYLVWPYIRSFVATVTAFSLLPSFTVPTLAVPRPEVYERETGEFDALEPGSDPRGPAG